MTNKDPRHRNITCGINGWWFLHYTSYPDGLSRKRTRINLWTKDHAEAVKKRDEILSKVENRTTYKIYQ